MRPVVALLLGMTCFSSPPARAEIVRPPGLVVAEPQEEQAAAIYDEAARLAQAGDFPAARFAVARAIALAPTAQRAALLGAIAIELGSWRQALEALIMAAELDTNRERDDYIARRLAAMPAVPATEFGIVRIEIVPPGPARCEDVSGDAFDVDATQFAIGMRATKQVLVCRMSGHRDARIELEVTARSFVTTRIEFAPESAEVGTVPPPVATTPSVTHAEVHRTPPRHESLVLPATLIIGGGVVLVGAIGAHLWAIEAVDRGDAARKEAASDYDGARAAYDDAAGDLELRRALAIGGYAAGGIALGVGIGLALSEDDPGTASVLPLFDGHGGGAACAFSF